MRFDELRLAEPIVRAVAAEGYETPTPIQAQAIPPVLAGKDVLGCAQTGTGKTGAFALPILHRLANGAGAPAGNGRRKGHHTRPGRLAQRPRALVLAPTRELATQIYESFRTYGGSLRLRHAVIFGGVSQVRQVAALRAGVDVIVATPGRLLDLMNQRLVDLRAIEIFVLDEADRMLDMGFIRDIRKVVECLPAKRQTLLFSATMPAEIRQLADSVLRDPIAVQATPESSTVEAIAQSVYFVAKKSKPALLERLLQRADRGRTLVFTRTKYGADRVVRNLRRAGVHAAAIHGNKSQNARTRALDGFKSGDTPVLVATDIAARGIDVDEITHVVNYDVPNIAETYVHRIGRTARAGASGIAVSFCDPDELDHLRAIERLINADIEVARDESDIAVASHPRPTRSETRSGSSAASRRSPSGGRRGRGRAKTPRSRSTSGKRSRR